MPKCRCVMCEEPIDGEPAESSCGCGETDCEHEKFAPLEWYFDGHEYACRECGRVHVAIVDGGGAYLDPVSAPDGICPCGGEVERNAEGMWWDGCEYRCKSCGATYEAVVRNEEECDMEKVKTWDASQIWKAGSKS